MAISHEDLNSTIAEIYGAVGDPAGFDAPLRSIRRIVDGSSAMLFTPFVSPEAGGFGFVDDVDPELLSRYRAYYWDEHPGVRDARRKGLLDSDDTVSDESGIPFPEPAMEEILSALLVPFDVSHLLCHIVVRDSDVVLPRVYLNVYRGVTAKPFPNEAIAALRIVGPHVKQALRLDYRLRQVERERASIQDALHEARFGLVIVDNHKHVAFMNRAAERLCGSHSGLVVTGSNGRCMLRATCAPEDARLQADIDSALREDRAAGTARSDSIPVCSSNGGGTLLVTVLPLPPSLPLGSLARAPARVAIFMESSTTQLQPAHRLFVALFGLTRAECRIADALLAGQRPKEIAERLSVSENTIRTHLKALSAKTNTRGITALVMLLTRVTSTQVSGDSPRSG